MWPARGLIGERWCRSGLGVSPNRVQHQAPDKAAERSDHQPVAAEPSPAPRIRALHARLCRQSAIGGVLVDDAEVPGGTSRPRRLRPAKALAVHGSQSACHGPERTAQPDQELVRWILRQHPESARLEIAQGDGVPPSKPRLAERSHRSHQQDGQQPQREQQPDDRRAGEVRMPESCIHRGRWRAHADLMAFDHVVGRKEIVDQHQNGRLSYTHRFGVMSRSDCHLYTMRLPYRPPLAWAPLLAFLSARAIPGIEAVSDDVYRRTIEVDGQAGHIEVRHDPTRRALQLHAWLPDPRALADVAERVSRMFDLSAEPRVIATHLGTDDVLAGRVRRLPGLRVPGAWDGFELGIRAILGQQVTVKGASTLAGRLVRMCGRPDSAADAGLSHLFPRPADLAAADLSTLGVPVKRRLSLQAFAAALAEGQLSFTQDGVEAALDALPGIGAWTVQYVLMRACGDPDAFPASDLWLRRSAGASSTSALIARAEAWRPFRAYAAMYLWQVA